MKNISKEELENPEYINKVIDYVLQFDEIKNIKEYLTTEEFFKLHERYHESEIVKKMTDKLDERENND